MALTFTRTEKATSLAIIRGNGSDLDGNIIWSDRDYKPKPDNAKYNLSELKSNNNETIYFTKLDLDNSEKFQPVPNTAANVRDVLYIAGGQGVGKSFYLNMYVKNWIRIYKAPENLVYIFSAIKNDSSFTFLKHERVDQIPLSALDDDYETTFATKTFANSLVIFDDIDTVDLQYKHKINELIRKVVNEGRHYNVFCAITLHLLLAGNASKELINSASAVTMFPTDNYHHTSDYLKKYAGLKQNQIDEAIKMSEGKWLTLYTKFPKVIMTEKHIYKV